jgi:hypothetical protein
MYKLALVIASEVGSSVAEPVDSYLVCLHPYFLSKIQKKLGKIHYFFKLMIYYLFNGHKNIQVGSGSVNNRPPGFVTYDYESADPNPKEIFMIHNTAWKAGVKSESVNTREL